MDGEPKVLTVDDFQLGESVILTCTEAAFAKANRAFEQGTAYEGTVIEGRKGALVISVPRTGGWRVPITEGNIIDWEIQKV
jgi:hypothetical protein